MSAFEIVEPVLIKFPVIVSSAEYYQNGFKSLQKWNQFRTEFINFIDVIDVQRLLFDQMLKRFLISAEVVDDEVPFFLTTPGYEGWHREELVKNLETKLGTSYIVYQRTMQTIDSLAKEMSAMLAIKDGEVGTKFYVWHAHSHWSLSR
jgi:hypothetical protein